MRCYDNKPQILVIGLVERNEVRNIITGADWLLILPPHSTTLSPTRLASPLFTISSSLIDGLHVARPCNGVNKIYLLTRTSFNINTTFSTIKENEMANLNNEMRTG